MKTTIVIITLDRTSKQVQELLSLLNNQGLTGKIVAGVDGRENFPELKDGERIDQERSLKMQLVELTTSEIGCYLSHFRTIRNAYDEGLERICILEDDVLIESDFEKVLSSVEKLPDEIEHIRLMGLKRHKRKSVCKVGDSRQLTRPVKGPCGAQGYVVNRRGMEKILRFGGVIAKPIDKFYDHFWDIDLRSYCVEPHVIWERAINESSIVKMCRDKASAPLSKRLKKHIVKLHRSLKRKIYILKNWSDFSFATKPAVAMGKTARIR